VVVVVVMHLELLIQVPAAVAHKILQALQIQEVVVVVGLAITLKAATVDLEWSLSNTPIHSLPLTQQVVPLLQQSPDLEFIHLPVLVHLIYQVNR
jgi:hypothetical protein